MLQSAATYIACAAKDGKDAIKKTRAAAVKTLGGTDGLEARDEHAGGVTWVRAWDDGINTLGGKPAKPAKKAKGKK